MGPNILCIETSANTCSVCLAQGGDILGIKESNVPNSHAASIAVFVNKILKENNLLAKNIDAICISKGPGSYTGLRIGFSLAKGICYSFKIPLIGISTLDAMFNGMKMKKSSAMFCPMIDARRMEVYTAVFDSQSNILLPEQPMILNENTFSSFDISRMIFFGSGAMKLKEIHPNIHIEEFNPSASNLIQPAINRFKINQFDDIAYFEPNYIKPFYSVAIK